MPIYNTHSPGPWRLAKSGQIVDVNNRAIARVWNTSKRDQDRANGELIAMAPSVRDEFRKLFDQHQKTTAALALCVRAIDNLLPGAAHIPADIGLINEALMAARPLVEGV